MRIYRHIGDIDDASGCAVACGAFDGLHLGHRRLLAELAADASERRVVLFEDRPNRGPRLASRRRCFEEFAESGVAIVVMARGGRELSSVLGALAPSVLLAGGGETGASEVLSHPRAREIEPVLADDGRPISSELLRAAVAGGDVRAAAAMVGRPYAVEGRVVHGFHRGATIGVPTANLRVRDLQLPPDGVYAVTVKTAVHSGVGVANLGTNPTFGNDERSLETNIFDFKGDLYGSRLEVGFVERLRGEKKFDGVDALVAQIHGDIDAARTIHRRS